MTVNFLKILFDLLKKTRHRNDDGFLNCKKITFWREPLSLLSSFLPRSTLIAGAAASRRAGQHQSSFFLDGCGNDHDINH
ncbi:MAG: hypothetical protein IPN58_21480 [Anaerolineales bacterium]|nr:hypothetical protein [Anaerolineales bacterium]